MECTICKSKTCRTLESCGNEAFSRDDVREAYHEGEVQETVQAAARLVDGGRAGPEEFAQGHLQGAMLVDVKSADFEAKVGKLARKDRYILYCRSGHRSGMALEKMKGMGFSNLQHVAGGIGAWTDAGLPTVQ